MSFDPAPLAAALETAWNERAAVEPFTETGALTTVEDAYAVQQAWTAIRTSSGDRILGHKVGFTAKAMQELFGITEPDYGGLLASRKFSVENGRVEVPHAILLQPKLEGEIAFHLGKPLRGPGVTMEDVLDATTELAVSAEIVDSRIADWRIKIVDTIADNASFGAFAVGPWDESLRDADFPNIRMLVRRGEEVVLEGTGDVVLGHPARSVAWLVNRMAAFGVTLEAGSIVLSGSLGGAVDARQGDEFTVELDGQEPLRVAFV
jgi:2-keto-4-pentenoate hydratase